MAILVRFRVALAFAALAVLASPARAAVFTLEGAGTTFVFTIADSPVPDVYYDENQFSVYDVTAPSASGLADFTFSDPAFNAPYSGSLHIEDFNSGSTVLYDLFGPKLYSGSEAAPTFVYGDYALTAGNGTPYSLTIGATAVIPAPEPEGWVMLICGFGLIGAAMRRMKVSVRPA